MSNQKEIVTVDVVDQQLLQELQKDARTSNTALARLVNLSPSGLQKRLRKLEEQNLISSYTAILNHELLGFSTICFMRVTLTEKDEEAVKQFLDGVLTIPELLECYYITGKHSYQLKTLVRDHQALTSLISKIKAFPAVTALESSLVLSEIKRTNTIAL